MKVNILGCLVDNLTMEETLSRIEEFINDGSPHQHVVVNVDKIVKANRDPALRDIINGCDLINPDGMPVVWASRLLNKPLKERVAGIDLFLKLVERSANKGWRVFFLGARENIVTKVVNIFKGRYPSLKLSGYRNGYWQTEHEGFVVEEIKKAKPDILFVAISSPKKEKFLNKWMPTMEVPFCMGVGGSFDIVSGRTKRAPVWMQQYGMEWFYRILQEPGRMWKRYATTNPVFIWMVFTEYIKLKLRTRR